jgi:hypothetical protein
VLQRRITEFQNSGTMVTAHHGSSSLVSLAANWQHVQTNFMVG